MKTYLDFEKKSRVAIIKKYLIITFFLMHLGRKTLLKNHIKMPVMNVTDVHANYK